MKVSIKMYEENEEPGASPGLRNDESFRMVGGSIHMYIIECRNQSYLRIEHV